MPAAVGAALEALRIVRSDEGPQLLAKVLDNARYWHEGLSALGLHVVAPTTLPDGTELITPIVPVLVGDDWKAFLLWKALWDEGAFVNVAVHPAVPPGGALLRTSVMATHERADLDHALELVARVVERFTRARPAAGPDLRLSARTARRLAAPRGLGAGATASRVRAAASTST